MAYDETVARRVRAAIASENGGEEKKRRSAMIKGVHTMFYSSPAEELRAFIRDKLGFTYTDVADGWLIFDLPEGDVGCHPSGTEDGKVSGAHNISFYCDDIEATVTELKGRDFAPGARADA